MDFIFALCVWFLEWLAALLGTTYVAINVWIFCVIWPVLTIGLIAYIIQLRKEVKRLNKQLEGPNVTVVS